MKMKVIKPLVTCILIAVYAPLFAHDDTIQFSRIYHTMVPRTRGIYGLTHIDGNIYTISQKGNFLDKIEYDASKPRHSEEAFGKTSTDTAMQERFMFSQPSKNPEWEGMAKFQSSILLFLNAHTSQIGGYQLEKMANFLPGDIVVDLLKPPKDTRGEPTSTEIKEFRKNFLKRLKSLNHTNPFTGITRIPKKLRENDLYQFIIGSRVEGFPLLTLSCQEENPTRCRIERGCFTEGMPHSAQQSLFGISIGKDRTLVAGDQKEHRLLLFRYHSCHHITFLKFRYLSKKIPPVASLSIDSEDRLWIGTTVPDNYHNASVFVFHAADWRGKVPQQ